jgi:hypothetical protein
MSTYRRVTATVGESLSAHFSIFRFDLRHILPSDWEGDVLEAAERHGKFSCLNGGSVTSRQREFRVTADDIVGVSTGADVSVKIPWLFELYASDILNLANELGIGHYSIAEDVRSAININILPSGSQYEWHVDSNPLTGLLFVTDHPVGSGGQLVFRPDPLVRPAERWELSIAPRAGDFLLFDAREAAHTVLPVPGPIRLISVPMNYYFADVSCHRPADLDQYLYSDRVLDRNQT